MTFSNPNPGYGHGIFRRSISLNASRGLSAIAEFLVPFVNKTFYCRVIFFSFVERHIIDFIRADSSAFMYCLTIFIFASNLLLFQYQISMIDRLLMWFYFGNM